MNQEGICLLRWESELMKLISEKIKGSKINLSSAGVQMVERKENNAADFSYLNVVDTISALEKPFNNEA